MPNHALLLRVTTGVLSLAELAAAGNAEALERLADVAEMLEADA